MMREARLGDVVASMKNGLYKPASEYGDDGVPCLRMYNIEAGSIVWRNIKRMRVSPSEMEEYGLHEGDLLVNRVNSRELVGKTSFIPASMEPSVFESKNIRVRLDPTKALPKFINYQLFARGRQFFAGNAQQVVGMASISQKQLADFPIVLTDLDQQKRIVAEIEKQFSRLDEAVANLKRVKANLKRYKAAVLKAAVEGRLVETEAERARRLLARGAQASEGRSLPTPRPGVFYVYAIRCNDDSIYIGHTDDLARRWEEHLAGQGADWTKQHKPLQIVHYEEYTSRQEAADREKWLKTGYGRKWIKREIGAGRARQVGYETGEQLLQRILETRRSQWQGKGKYKEPAAPDTTDLRELPEGWVWATMPQLGDLGRGKSKHRPRDDAALYGGPYPFIQTGDVRRSEGSIAEYTQTYSELGLAQSRLWPTGTLCITIAANIAETGILSFASCFPDSVVGFISGSDSVTTKYVELFIRTAKSDLERFAPATAQKNINLEVLEAVAIALPPVAEQHRIVAEVDRRLSIVRETEAEVDSNLKRAQTLRQAILGRAFGTDGYKPS